MLTGVFGAFVVPPEDRRAHVFFLLLIGLVCAAHTLTFGHARYHLPLMPLVLTYSAAAMANLGTVWAARKRPWFWIAALVCAVLVASWIWQTVAMDLGRFTGAMQSLGG